MGCHTSTTTPELTWHDRNWCNECDVQIIDPPGPSSLGHGYSLHYGLTSASGPLNSIFILIEFHPRIVSKMVDDFWDTFHMLKYEHLAMVTVLITKMDHLKSGGMWASMDHAQKYTREIFEEDVGF